MSSAPPAPGRRGDARRVLAWTLALNVAVAAAKVTYGTFADALAIRADGFHSLTDSANNVVGLLALGFALAPPDEDHHYGHRRIELMAAVLVGASMLGLAVDVTWGAIDRLLHGGEVPRVTSGAFAVLGVTLVVNLGVARWERRQGERLGSPFLISDAEHTRSDALVTLSVMAAMAGVAAGLTILDVVAAFGVAAFVALAGVRVLRSNLAWLADTAPVNRDAIARAVLAVPGVASCHKIRARGFPGAIHVDLHLQIAPHLDVVMAHRVTHLAMDAVRAGIPAVTDVVIHTEPAPADAAYNPIPAEWGRT